MNEKPYTREELEALAQSIHDRECEKGVGVYLGIIQTEGKELCTAMCVGLDLNGIANVIQHIMDDVGMLPFLTVMGRRGREAMASEGADPSGPADAAGDEILGVEVLEI